MPDISMCQNDNCPKRADCYRFTAKPGERQSYANFQPDEKGECEYFYETKN